MFRSINPATGEELATYPLHSAEEVEGLLNSARSAQRSWRKRPIEERAAIAARIGERLLADQDKLALLTCHEMGKPILQGHAEVQKSAKLARFYSEQAPALLRSRSSSPLPGGRSRMDPLGVILGIMPWNFPVWQVIRFAIPTLIAGNAVIFKHAPNVGGVAAYIESLAAEAGLPESLLTSLRVEPPTIAELIADPRIVGVSLTGSERAGRAVAEAAGRALKPMVLELGGSDPCIIFPEADIEKAVEVGLKSRLLNTGQSCVAAKRFLVHRDIYSDVIEAMQAELARWPQGDPSDEANKLGPLARLDLAQGLERQAKQTISAGARLIQGTGSADGTFFEPTLLVDIPRDSAAWTQETFGPLLAVRPFDSLDEALLEANSSRYGLGASMWGDLDKLEPLVEEIDAGVVALNSMVRSDPMLPFGGVKASGIGREMGVEGLVAFTNNRTIWTS